MSSFFKWALGVIAAAGLWSGAADAATAIKACGAQIDAPGSYVVTANLTVRSGGGDCITVNSNYVTIDLGGFTIDCAGQNVSGITDLTVNYHGVVVRNGKITRCAKGLYLASRAILVDGVATVANQAGMYLGNSGNLVTRSISNDNTGSMTIVRDGIFLECPSAAVENTALGNTYQSIRTDQAGCVLTSNLAP